MDGMKVAASYPWSAVMTAIALSCSVPGFAQESTGDAFLDAMMSERREEGQAQTPSEKPSGSQVSEKATTEEPQTTESTVPLQTQYVSPTSETKLLDDEQLLRELGPTSGLGVNEAQLEGKMIRRVSIRYDGATPTLPEARLLDVIQTRQGSRYSSRRVNADLERLVERGLVRGNAQVSATEEGGGVSLVFHVQPSDVMGGVGFTGNRRFRDNELREKTKLQPGRVLSDRELSQACAEIVKAYQEAGYPDAQVSWRTNRTAQRAYEDVIFDIREGREVSMNRITFVGNKQFDGEQLRQILKTKERGLFTWITKSGRIDREILEEDLQSIVKQYRNYGYLRAKIAKVEYYDLGKSGNRERLHMRVTIDEGPRYRVRHVSFGSLNVYTPRELEPGLSMLDGDVYSLQKVSDDVTMIRKYYGAKGYADADVRPDIAEVGVKADGERLIDIRYDVNEGGRYVVGRVNVRGNTKTKQHVILRELPFKPGQLLNSVDLETAEKRLKNLGYFDAVSVSQGMSRGSGHRDINVDVHETMTGNFTFGVAFSSVENVYLYANIVQSNFDIKGLLNGVFVGGGQRLAVSGKLGTEYQSASIYLLEPWFMDRKLALGNEVYFSNSSYMSDYYRQTNYGYDISLRKALGDMHSVKFDYRLERYNLDPESYAPPFFRENEGDYTRSHFRFSYAYDSRDAVITPRKGGNFELYAGYSGPGSTVQTYTVGSSGSYYLNGIWDTIWSVNYAVETVDTVDDNKDVPLFERCYLGGPNNLRGFRYHDVGMVNPALAGDETMGGKSSAYAQFELTLPLVETVRLALFVDVGFVHAKSFDFAMNQFAADYGIGLRINLPMGPLAVDYAIPFESHNAVDDDGQFQFYVDYKY